MYTMTLSHKPFTNLARLLTYIWQGVTWSKVLIAIAVAVTFALSVTVFGYFNVRRTVLPFEALAFSILLYRLGKRFKTPTANMFTVGASVLVGICSIAALIGAFIDNIFFSDTGYFVFGIQAIMGLAVIVLTSEAYHSHKAEDVAGVVVDTFSTKKVSVQMTERIQEIEELGIRLGLK